ncbi:DUF1499 domain-containing protein [bacterium]|nr:DUF1499 domain-containing protein [bacterium]
MPATTSRLGRVSAWLGRVCLLLALLGPALAHFDLVAPLYGFGTFGLGLLVGIVSLALGAVALLLGPAGTRSATAAGLAIPVIVIGLVLLLSGARRNIPRINDIATDTDAPPQFVHAGTLPENAGRDMSYPGLAFAEQQKAGYPDLGPLPLAMPPDEAFKQVAAAARSMPSWVITREDPEAHALEGYDTTRLFHFRDDFVIEVRATPNGQSLVQMRSKSRDGKGDVGANAARIRAFFTRLES